MTITQDYQADLDGLTIGKGTDYRVQFNGFAGIGVPTMRISDVGFGVNQPGVNAGRDVLAERPVILPLMVQKTSTTTTRQAWETLKASFDPVTSGESTLQLRLPGTAETVMSLFGRPRGISNDELGPGGLWVSGTGLFTGTDPYWYGAAATISADSSSPIPVANAGTANSRRCTLTVIGSGSGIPVITNSADPDAGTIAFTQATSLTVVLDLFTQRATVSGVARDDLISPASRWFPIIPGTNNLTWATGITSIASSTRGAYP